MTLKQMRDRVVAEIGLQDIAAYSEHGLVNAELNRGVIDLLARTRCVVRCIHLQTTAGVGTYTLDHKIMSIVEIEDGAQRQRRDDEYGHYPTLNPPYHGRRGFTLIRSDVLRIPPPDTNGEVDIWAVVRPTPMAADTDDVGTEAFGAIPDEFQGAIVDYAMWQCSSYADDQSGAMGDRYRVLYEGQDGRGGRLREIRMMVNKRGTQRFPRSRGRNLRGTRDRSAWVG